MDPPNFHPKTCITKMVQNSLKCIFNTTFFFEGFPYLAKFVINKISCTLFTYYSFSIYFYLRSSVTFTLWLFAWVVAMLNILQLEFCWTPGGRKEINFWEVINFSYLLWTLRPGKMLPGVAGMVTTWNNELLLAGLQIG